MTAKNKKILILFLLAVCLLLSYWIWLCLRPVEIVAVHQENNYSDVGNDSNLLIVFYVQIMPDDLVMQLHRF